MVKEILYKYKWHLIALCFLVGAILIIKTIINENAFNTREIDENILAIFDVDKPIPIKSNGKYGYISKDGELLIEPVYEYATEFFKNYAGVSTNGLEYSIIDRKGEVVLKLTSGKAPECFLEYGVWIIDNALYSSDLKVLFDEKATIEYVQHGFFLYLSNEKEESGIIDYKGNKIFTWDHDFLNVTISDTKYQSGGYYAIVNDYEEDEMLISLKTGEALYTIDDVNSKYLREEKDNIFRVINKDNGFKSERWMYFKDDRLAFEIDNQIYSLEVYDYDNNILMIDYGQDYQNAGRKERYSYYDMERKAYLRDIPEKDDISWKLKSLYGYELSFDKDKQGLKIDDKEVLAPEYDRVFFLEDNLHEYLYGNKGAELTLYEKNGKTTLYNITRKDAIITFDSPSVESKSGSTFILVTEYEENGYSKKNYILYNIFSNKTLEVSKKSVIYFGSNYVAVSIGDEKSYYNEDLKEIYREKIDNLEIETSIGDIQEEEQ